MSNKIFYIPGLNGIRYTNEFPTLDSNLNSLPADSEIDLQSYAIPIQQTDTEFPALICLSDYDDLVLEFFVSATNQSLGVQTLGATDSSIVGETFLQYLAIVDFSTFPVGWCYGRVSYTDDDDNPQSWITCPIDVQANHPTTQLIQYQNSENTESVLFFPANIILQMRIDGNFTGGYQPKANTQTFEDQEYSPVLLNGFNYDIYTHYIGGGDAVQIPDWVIKKLNLIWQKCDQVKIDYEFYVVSGDFKIERPQYTPCRNGFNVQLDLQIVPGYQFGQLIAGTTPTGDLIVVRKVWPVAPFSNFTGKFAVNGIFTQYTTLDYLQTINYNADTFDLKLGTSLGANDILETEIGTPNADASIELIETHTFRKGLNVATTVYCTIPDGVNIKALFIYDQLDAPPLNIPTVGGGVPQGMIGFYKELVAGYFTRDWDITTGLGQVGSAWEGYQIYDEAAGKVLVPWDRTTTDPDLGRGTPGITGALEVGNPGNEVTITQAALPNVGLNLFTNQINSTAGDTPGPTDSVAYARSVGTQALNYEMLKGTIPPTLGVTAVMGAGGSLNIANDGLIELCWIKL